MRNSCQLPTCRSGIFGARAFVISTDRPEADGTLSWNKRHLIVVNVTAGNIEGIGYTYADAAIVRLINNTLADIAIGSDATNTERRHERIMGLRQESWPQRARGVCNFSLRPRSMGHQSEIVERQSRCSLGCRRQQVEIYGSGGFTTYDDTTLTQQLSNWVNKDGCSAVKMKIGSDRARDPEHIRRARRAVGEAALFVDANGAYATHDAIQMMPLLSEFDVRWFEEPVSLG